MQLPSIAIVWLFVSFSQGQICPQREYDMYVLLDESLLDCAINENNADIVKEFVHNIAQKYNLGPQGAPRTRIGLIKFSDDDVTEWSIVAAQANDISDFHATLATLENANKQLRCSRCAIDGANTALTPGAGLSVDDFRDVIPQVAVLVTGGINTVGDSPHVAAAKLRAAGVEVFVLELNPPGITTDEAVDIVCNVTSRAFAVENNDFYAELHNDLAQDLTETICAQVQNAPPQPKRWSCTTGATLSDGKCYKAWMPGKSTFWQSAEDKCVALSSHLASITSQTENDYVYSLFVPPATKYAWIGLERDGSTFAWANRSSPYAFTNWDTGAPDNDQILEMGDENCVEMILPYGCGTPGKWNDRPCTVREVKNYVCEIEDASCGKRGFHNIANMANTIGAVDWAVGIGANGLAVDLKIAADGSIVQFKHGKPCECDCLCIPILGGTPCAQSGNTNSTCAALEVDFPGNACNAATAAETLLEHIATKDTVATLLIRASGVSDIGSNTTAMTLAGQNTAQLLKNHLLDLDFAGQVIINVPKIAQAAFLRAVATAMVDTGYDALVKYTINGELNDIDDTLDALLALPTKNLVYSTGSASFLPLPVLSAACSPIFFAIAITPTTKRLAVYNEARGVVGLTLAHTIDDVSSIIDSFKYFRGVVTNFPGLVKKLVNEKGLNLVTPCSIVSPATSYHMVQNITDHLCAPCTTIPESTSNDTVDSVSEYACSCTWNPPGVVLNLNAGGGCKISSAAPAGTACLCTSNLPTPLPLLGALGGCTGTVVQCKDPYHAKCKNPDTTIASCQQVVGNNCAGY